MNISKFALIGFATLLSSGAFAGVEIDLALPTITGTDTVDGISGLIPIASYSLNDSPKEFFVQGPVDANSPSLRASVVAGQHFTSATLDVFESKGTGPLQLSNILTFTDVIAKSYEIDSTVVPPYEVVGFSYQGFTDTPVPLPATAWLMLSGLGCLGFMARQRAASITTASIGSALLA